MKSTTARVRVRLGLTLAGLSLSLITALAARLLPLSDDQIDEAIAVGKKSDVPIALVGRMLGISKGLFDVFIEGPMGRIASAAEKATKQLRPFTRDNVTTEMKEPVYRVLVQHAEHADFAMAQHIVLMPKGSKNLDNAIQPVRESPRLLTGVYFGRLPEGDFDVVQVFFPEGLRFDGTKLVGTGATLPVFNYLNPVSDEKKELVDLTGIEPVTS